MTMNLLRETLDRRSRPALFWLRDDDAVEPTKALDRLLALGGGTIPITIAAIPALSGPALAKRLTQATRATVAVHGWAHRNHAPESRKNQELGADRPIQTVLNELTNGLLHLRALHGPRFLPMLVPPWNRIDAQVTAGLPAIGFSALSVFGPEKSGPIRAINTHVDLIDWRGSRGGRPDGELASEILSRLDQDDCIGVLSHHLVHDAQAWGFLERLVAATVDHPNCQWVSARDLMG